MSGFAMLQHQIKAVHDSAHQEEKQRQDHGDLERRPLFNTRSPTVIDRDGMRTKTILLSPPSCSSLLQAPSATGSGLFIGGVHLRSLWKKGMVVWTNVVQSKPRQKVSWPCLTCDVEICFDAPFWNASGWWRGLWCFFFFEVVWLEHVTRTLVASGGDIFEALRKGKC